MILLKYHKVLSNPTHRYPSNKDIAEWEESNGPLDEIDGAYAPWRIFRFMDEDIATAFRMRFPKNENR